MNQLENLLFSLIKYGVEGKEIPKAEETSPQMLAEVCNLANSHDLLHLVSHAISSLGVIDEGTPFFAALEHERLKAIYRAERISNELSALCALFDEENIDYIPLKGSVIRNAYPEPWMRTSSDIDILMREDDAERAAALAVERLGYRNDGKARYDIQLFSPTGLHFELHFALVEGDPKIDAVLDEVWEHATGGNRKKLDDGMFVFYHLAHMAKHCLHGGCGVRPILDLWVLESIAHVDISAAIPLLERSGLKQFYDGATQLCSAWFSGKEHTPLSSEFSYFLLGAGVYGNLENHVAANSNRLKYTLSLIFPSPESLANTYPVLKKHKWLLPICHLRRWLRLIFCGGLSRSAKTLKTISTIDSKKQKRTLSLFDKLGLDK